MLEYFLKGILLGLSLSTSCLATCGPIYAPYLMMEKRSFLRNLRIVLEISLGRFITYAIFGAIAGYLGSQISGASREILTGFSYIGLSVFLVIYTIGQTKAVNHIGCKMKKWVNLTKNYPLLLGLITGISFCPSFLIALSSAFENAGVLSGMLFFVAFFIGTSVVIIPLSFIGILPNIKLNFMRKVGYIASIFVVIYFTFSGVRLLSHSFGHSFNKNQKVIYYLDGTTVFYLYGNEDKEFLQNLKTEFEIKSSGKLILLDVNEISEKIKNFNANSYFIISSEIADTNPILNYMKENYLEKMFFALKLPILENDVKKSTNMGDRVSEIIEYLDYYRFKTTKSGAYINFH